MSIFNPINSDQLTAALREARPGDVIQLLPQTYIGQFTLAAPTPRPILNAYDAAAATKPITLRGTKSIDYERVTTIKPTLNNPPNIPISIRGGKWVVTGLVIRPKCYWDFNFIGVNIQGDGHVLDDLTLNCKRFRHGIRINGDNNRIQSVKISNSKTGICIEGTGNSVKDTVLSRILHNGIIVLGVGTNIQTTSVHMKKNIVRTYTGRFVSRFPRPPVINQGRSLDVDNYLTTLNSSIFHGVALISKPLGEINSCKFEKLNLMADQNNFKSTTIDHLYRMQGLQFTTFDDQCNLGLPSNEVLQFD